MSAPGVAPYTVHRGTETYGPYDLYPAAVAKAESLSTPPPVHITDAQGNKVWPT